MASFFGISDTTSLSTFFGTSTNTSSTSTSSSDTTLSDYASIKNGSYKKLMKAYYAKQESSTSVSDGDKSTTSKYYALLKSDSDAMQKSANALKTNSSLYEKKTVTNEDGTTTSEYDMDTLYSKVKSFIDDYNSILDSYDKVNNTNILKKGIYLVKNTNANQNMLSKIGITIGSGNKLEIKEDTFKSADMNDIKAMFYGNGSFADSAALKASQTSSLAQNAVNKISSLYDSSAGYLSTLNSSNIIDQYF